MQKSYKRHNSIAYVGLPCFIPPTSEWNQRMMKQETKVRIKEKIIGRMISCLIRAIWTLNTILPQKGNTALQYMLGNTELGSCLISLCLRNPNLSILNHSIYFFPLGSSSQWWFLVLATEDPDTAFSLLQLGSHVAPGCLPSLRPYGERRGCHWMSWYRNSPDSFRNSWLPYSVGKCYRAHKVQGITSLLELNDEPESFGWKTVRAIGSYWGSSPWVRTDGLDDYPQTHHISSNRTGAWMGMVRHWFFSL